MGMHKENRTYRTENQDMETSEHGHIRNILECDLNVHVVEFCGKRMFVTAAASGTTHPSI